jgi:murein DD-endopeptidase MepM/ murein hydrolase activator NlpD
MINLILFMVKKSISAIFIFIIILISSLPNLFVHAQTEEPIYIVQPGDTLNAIAGRFGISLNELLNANNITNPNFIAVGQSLIIPGLPGISGILTSNVILLGENLDTLAREYRIQPSIFIRLNRITSRSELYAGASVILPQQNENQISNHFIALAESETLLEIAAKTNTNPWAIILDNQMDSSTELSIDDKLLLPDGLYENGSSLISPFVKSFSISPLPLIQGSTVEIILTTFFPMEVKGSLNGIVLNFFLQTDGSYVAFQGIHAESPIGLSPFEISGTDNSSHQFTFNQMLLLGSANFGKDPVLAVDPITLDPANTQPEEDQIHSIISNVSDRQLWQGKWQYPIDEPVCTKSSFGNRRSYNGSEFIYFHTGVDFGICAPSLNIYASAPGIVVFAAGPLTIRGNATIIDHGFGVFSAYYHQKELRVNVGDSVSQGQLIGLVGDTGRVMGPHLHFEVWVNGVQVQPIDWLEKIYP